ncbi:MAG: gamma carbonic anhydrase family protein [Candidatus Methanoperedens sp.]|nr:gamma carbonic anhydrase family protein [Candidatus Methanoperedens sp.]
MIYTFEDKKPLIAKNAFIADTACIIGNVTIGERSSVWFNSVIRGDRAKISIGKGCNIQDNVVVHSDERDVEIGDKVTIGHGSVMHGCIVKNNALIGMNATVLHGAEIGEFSIVGAGALVPPGHKIPANSLVFGIPCKHARSTTDKDIELINNTLKNYEDLTARYLKLKGK